jgi:hypothetical protein
VASFDCVPLPLGTLDGSWVGPMCAVKTRRPLPIFGIIRSIPQTSSSHLASCPGTWLAAEYSVLVLKHACTEKQCKYRSLHISHRHASLCRFMCSCSTGDATAGASPSRQLLLCCSAHTGRNFLCAKQCRPRHLPFLLYLCVS